MNINYSFVANSFVVLAMCCLSTWAWHQVPHPPAIAVFDDSKKLIGLVVVPLIGVGLTAAFVVLRWLDRRYDVMLMLTSRAYLKTVSAAMLLLLSLHAAIILQILGWQIDVGTVAWADANALLAVIGNYFKGVPYYPHEGVGGPWNHDSLSGWNQTQQWRGKWVVRLGICGTIAALLNVDRLFLIPLLCVTLICIVPLVINSQDWVGD
jgi:uncharacterized membrane protein